MAIDIKGGVYKGRAVPGSQQFGESKNGNPEMLLDLNIKINDRGDVRRVTTPLYFSPEAAQYSFDRLRACGWKGDSLDDGLPGIDANEVDVEIKHEDYQGEAKTKVQILSGGGRFVTAKPVAASDFAARVKAISGSPASSAPTGASPTGSPPKPPF